MVISLFSSRCYLIVLLGFLWLPLSASSNSVVEVVDDIGKKITLMQPAKRLVSLSPHLTELAYEAGAGEKLVATVDFANYPEDALKLKRVGSHNAIDTESLLAMEPDLVLAWLSGSGRQSIEYLESLGLNVYVSEPDTLLDISRTIRDIGMLAGTSATSEQTALAFEDRLAVLKANYSGRELLKVFIQVWQQPLITVNGKQLISHVVELCGGKNVFGNETVLAPVITVESLLVRNPEVIIGTAVSARQETWMETWLSFGDIQAVKSNNLYFIKPDLLNRHTSRILQGAEQMCAYFENARKKRALP